MIKISLWVLLISSSIVNACFAKKHSMLLLGDSLSAAYGMPVEKGWVHLLNKRFAEQKSSIEITNASISGETTAGGLSRLPSLLANNNYDWLLVELGANDGLRGFPPHIIKNNLLQMIELAQEKGINVAVFNIKILPNYGPRYNKMFAEVFTDVTTNSKVPLLPFFMETIALQPQLMMADDLHPNQKAQPLIRDIVEQSLLPLLAGYK